MARRLQDLLQEPGCSPDARASTLNAVAYGLWLDCAYAGSENALREAANMAKSLPPRTPDPLHLHTRHLLAFARRDRNEMAECVHAIRQAINPTWHHGMTVLSQALAEQALLREDLAAAARHWSSAVTEADAACALPLQWASRLALAGCRAAQSDCAGAAKVLQQARGLFAEAPSEDSVRDDAFLAAYIALRRADRSECHRLLGSALRAAPLPGGASRLFHLSPAAMADLCMHAMRAEIGVGSVRSLVEHQETIIKGVLEEVGNRSVDQLGKERDELLLGLLRLRSKLTKTLKTPRRSPAHPTDRRPGSRIKPS
jgi:hypothetical protein